MADSEHVLTESVATHIRLDHVRQGYRNRTVLDDFSLKVGSGVTAILGPNGAGKTTLLRTMVTDLPPRAGSVTFGNITVSGRKETREARRRIGFLPQDFTADPAFTVIDLVRYAAWLRETERDEDVDEAITAVGLTDQATTKIRRLSGGMKQRAAIAAAIVGWPPVLVFDEPTVGLDPAQRVYFRKVLETLRDHCVILSTHLIEDVVTSADRVVVINNGLTVFDGSPGELAASAPDEERGSTSAAEWGYLSVIARSAT